MRECLVLRDTSSRWQRDPSISPWGTDAFALQAKGTGPPKVTVSLTNATAACLDRLAKDPQILAVAPVMPTRLVAPEPLDEVLTFDAVPGWGLEVIGAKRSFARGSETRIAILDTGIDAQHKAFADTTITRRDFVGNGSHDDHGHGTHCAATILGGHVESHRIGVAPGLKHLLVGKIIADYGRGTSAMLFSGLVWALSQDARIALLSAQFDADHMTETLIADNHPQALASAMAQEAHYCNLALLSCLLRCSTTQRGDPLTLIVPAGNDSRRMLAPHFDVGASAMASIPGVISVGAIGPAERDLRPARFSNTHPTLVAPGVGIVSAAADGGLRPLNGTTMAAAHVVGAAALWHEEFPGVPLRDVMLAACRTDRLSPDAGPYSVGTGLLQVPCGSL